MRPCLPLPRAPRAVLVAAFTLALAAAPRGAAAGGVRADRGDPAPPAVPGVPGAMRIPIPAALARPRRAWVVELRTPQPREPIGADWGLGYVAVRTLPLTPAQAAAAARVLAHPVFCPPESADRVCASCDGCGAVGLEFQDGRDTVRVVWEPRAWLIVVASRRERSLGYAGLDSTSRPLLEQLLDRLDVGRYRDPWAAGTPPFRRAAGAAGAPALGAYDDIQSPPSALASNAPPVYPPSAQAAGITGTVVVRARIGLDGGVEVAQVVHSIPALDAAALAAARSWRFEPARCGSRPVRVWLTLPVAFPP